MKSLIGFMVMLCCSLGMVSTIQAQDAWPKVITASDGSIIKIYEPQPESFTGNILKTRSAVSIQETDKADPTFGTFWAIETVETDKDSRQISVVSVKVPNLKMAAETDDNKISYLKTTLETEIPKMGITLPMDAVLSSLDMHAEEKKLSKGLNNNPPKVLFASKPSILVVIDGEPKLQRNNDWGVDAVVNTAFTIVKNYDGNFYLYGGKHWYAAPSVTGPYSYSPNVPSNLAKVQSAVDNASSADAGYTSSSAADQSNQVSDIIVSTQPAELIQTKGVPSFSPISGTNLSYVSNSDNDIFLDQSAQQYYILISGRWYTSRQMDGGWQYVASNALPADFARIPEGSPKDNVLASIAGTDAAREAVMDAQIPQTAKVDRRAATATVTYDGDPKFEPIPGTQMESAVNSQSTVLMYKGRYYCVDKGVWFDSDSPYGPWAVSTERPDDVDMIPPSNPNYNVKYVYIYDVTPDWVYTGYTPGYLNAYIYGPTVVYGTGFYYNPWWGGYYYPRAYTWGFGMCYNPWWGWSIGWGGGWGYGWFHGYGYGGGWGGWHGGYWGPSVYRPPYRPYGFRGSYYGLHSVASRPVVYNNNVRVTNNIYNSRRDVITRNNVRTYGNNNAPVSRGGFGNNGAAAGRPGTNNVVPQARQNITTDRQGNVYQRNTTAPASQQQWQQRNQRQWTPVDNSRSETIQNLNRQQQMHDRGEVRTQNFQTMRSAPSAPVSRPMSSGGGGRPSGGGGGGSRGGRH